jgi:nitroimidazol reductase NimA-like FMN-containing flavoprotein (pyridoxamine 5'-phosphate oxidase superfamily)
MLIHDLTRQASLDVLASTHLGRLACSLLMQPYIVPIHFAYQDNFLYSLSMPGQKIDWMRANPLVCVEADQMRRERWTTVVVLGRYEELPDTVEMRDEREIALRLLQQRPGWWEPGGVRMLQGDRDFALVPVYYRIEIAQITGRHATFEPTAPDTRPCTANPAKRGWLHKLLRQVRGR